MTQRTSRSTRCGRTHPVVVLVAVLTSTVAAACRPPHDATIATDAVAPPTSVAADVLAVPSVDAAAYAVFDPQTATVLASRAADARRPVGSLMKLLNAAVAYDAGDPDRDIVAPRGLAGADGESVIGIDEGQVVSRAVLIRAMLKVSANDAARLLAIDIAGSEDAYARMMNGAAASLGLTDTHAVNATGLDADGQFSSARDVITLAAALSGNADFHATVTDPTARFDGRTIPNTNGLLTTYRGADGIKTGHTSGAGYCLLASATRDGRRVIVAVLGSPTDEAREGAAATLLDWAFAVAAPPG